MLNYTIFMTLAFNNKGFCTSYNFKTFYAYTKIKYKTKLTHILK